MALKNTYSTSPVVNSLKTIEEALVGAGVKGIQKGYEHGQITSLMFIIDIKGRSVTFKLPVGWKKVQQVLKNEGIGRAEDDDYAYRVSWAIMRDWVTAQIAILATENVTMPQLFLPYAMASSGTTLFEAVMKTDLLLGPGK